MYNNISIGSQLTPGRRIVKLGSGCLPQTLSRNCRAIGFVGAANSRERKLSCKRIDKLIESIDRARGETDIYKYLPRGRTY